MWGKEFGMIHFQDTLEGIEPGMLVGFFVGWPNPPDPETHYRLLRNSAYRFLAVDLEAGRVAGFITAVSDGVLAAYIPHLEVLPAYQDQGIGSQLVQRMLAALQDIYMVDLVCDEALRPFYERFGLIALRAMARRNYAAQNGRGEAGNRSGG
jgi:ribosomal protein S18 acetylase RimI-like enzyme